MAAPDSQRIAAFRASVREYHEWLGAQRLVDLGFEVDPTTRAVLSDAALQLGDVLEGQSARFALDALGALAPTILVEGDPRPVYVQNGMVSEAVHPVMHREVRVWLGFVLDALALVAGTSRQRNDRLGQQGRRVLVAQVDAPAQAEPAKAAAATVNLHVERAGRAPQ